MVADPLIIIWRVTGHCDLGCQYCGYSRRLRRPRATAKPAQVLAFGRLLSDYRAHTGRDVQVSWLGGEPFRWPPLLDITSTFKHDGLRVSVTTNGTALASPQVRQQAAGFDRLTLSVDGIGPAHDDVRDHAGLYDQLRSSLCALHQLIEQQGRGPLLCANTVLMKSNLRNLESLCESLADWGVREMTFNLLGEIERGGPFFERERLGPEDVAWLRGALPAMRARLANRNLILRGAARYLDRLELQAREVAVAVNDCHPGARHLFIDEAGFAGPCSATARACGIALENLRSVGDLLALPAALSARRAPSPPACHDCRNTNLFGKFDAEPIISADSRRFAGKTPANLR